MSKLDELKTVVDAPGEAPVFEMELGLVRASCCWNVESEPHAVAMRETRELIRGMNLKYLGPIWDAVESVIAETAGVPDKVLLAARLNELGDELPAPPATEKDRNPAPVTIDDLFQAPPTPEVALAYAKQLRERWDHDQANHVRETAKALLEDAKDPEHAIETAMGMLMDHQTTGRAEHPIQPMSEELNDLEEYLEQMHGREFIGLPQKTIRKLDEYTRGLRGFMLLAGRPGCGKTNLGMQLGVDVVNNNADAILVFFSFEMSRREVEIRLLSRASRLPWKTLVQGDGSSAQPPLATGSLLEFSEAHQKAYQDGKKELARIADRIVVLDVGQIPSVTRSQMRAIIEHQKQRAGAARAFVLIDYLQTIPLPIPENLQGDEIGRHKHVIGELLKLQHDLDDPLLVISEQSKSGMRGGSLESVYGTVRASYSPDIVFVLDSEDNYDKPKIDIHTEEAKLDLVIEKGRDGVTRGFIPLTFKHTRSDFAQADRKNSLTQLAKSNKEPRT